MRLARAVERALLHASLVGGPVQPTNVRIEQHAVEFDASAVARVDMVWVSEWPPRSGVEHLPRLQTLS